MRAKRAKQLSKIAKKKGLTPSQYRRMKRQWTMLSRPEKEKAR